MIDSHKNKYLYVKSFFFVGTLSGLVTFVLMQLYFFIERKHVISVAASVFISFCVFVIMLGTSLVIGWKRNQLFTKEKLELMHYVSILQTGQYAERITCQDQSIFSDVQVELNELATFMQNQVKTLQRLAAEKTTLAKQAHQAAVIEERQRLARDLHDSISQQLFALNMLSSASLKTVQQDNEKQKHILTQMAAIALKAQGEMRALLLHLRPIDLRGDSLTTGLKKLLQELKGKTDLQIESELNETIQLTSAIEEHLFRIVQEALSNILRHAQAKKVKLQLSTVDEHIYLYISDDGRGFDMQTNKLTSYGLQTMRERCEELGGVFQLRSLVNEGTYIKLRIPIEQEVQTID